MVGPSSRVRTLPCCFVSDYFLQWLLEVECPCGCVRTSIEVKRVNPNCHPLSEVGCVAAADNDQYFVLFMRVTQEEKQYPSCTNLMD
jgi:hypothetical protein